MRWKNIIYNLCFDTNSYSDTFICTNAALLHWSRVSGTREEEMFNESPLFVLNYLHTCLLSADVHSSHLILKLCTSGPWSSDSNVRFARPERCMTPRWPCVSEWHWIELCNSWTLESCRNMLQRILFFLSSTVSETHGIDDWSREKKQDGIEKNIQFLPGPHGVWQISVELERWMFYT